MKMALLSSSFAAASFLLSHSWTRSTPSLRRQVHWSTLSIPVQGGPHWWLVVSHQYWLALPWARNEAKPPPKMTLVRFPGARRTICMAISMWSPAGQDAFSHRHLVPEQLVSNTSCVGRQFGITLPFPRGRMGVQWGRSGVGQSHVGDKTWKFSGSIIGCLFFVSRPSSTCGHIDILSPIQYRLQLGCIRLRFDIAILDMEIKAQGFKIGFDSGKHGRCSGCTIRYLKVQRVRLPKRERDREWTPQKTGW